MMELRPAQPQDQAIIRRIVREAGINPMGLSWDRFVVAMKEEKIVGIGQIKPHGDGSRELASIAVIPEFQGRGIATEIIRTLQTRGRPPLYLMCRARLETFYSRFGFRALDREEMPPYFRRIYRLATLASRLIRLGGDMRVMIWEGPPLK